MMLGGFQIVIKYLKEHICLNRMALIQVGVFFPPIFVCILYVLSHIHFLLPINLILYQMYTDTCILMYIQILPMQTEMANGISFILAIITQLYVRLGMHN